jgi:hypothetical protein
MQAAEGVVPSAMRWVYAESAFIGACVSLYNMPFWAGLAREIKLAFQRLRFLPGARQRVKINLCHGPSYG